MSQGGNVPVNSLLIVASIIVVLVILILYTGKRLCDMAIKSEITRKYSMMIFAPNQENAKEKISNENARWLEENSNQVEIISVDGLKLKGYEIKAKEKSDIWVITVHGYMNSGYDMVEYAKQFISYKYNVLIIDLRAHGKSEGTYIGMGWLDRLDLELWIDKIIEENKNSKIILYGISMGAATVSMATGDDLPKEVKVCIADCGYSSVWEEFKVHLNKIFHIPPFPLLYTASLMSKIYLGYSFEEASTIKQVKKSVTPTLFIHGTKDKFVPFSMLDEIYKKAKCEKQKLEIQGAGHGESSEVNPEQYWKTVQQFIKKYI